eukprot:2122419-Rhodomonas_salina.1
MPSSGSTGLMSTLALTCIRDTPAASEGLNAGRSRRSLDSADATKKPSSTKKGSEVLESSNSRKSANNSESSSLPNIPSSGSQCAAAALAAV